jgi:hypothetical protein
VTRRGYAVGSASSRRSCRRRTARPPSCLLQLQDLALAQRDLCQRPRCARRRPSTTGSRTPRSSAVPTTRTRSTRRAPRQRRATPRTASTAGRSGSLHRGLDRSPGRRHRRKQVRQGVRAPGVRRQARLTLEGRRLQRLRLGRRVSCLLQRHGGHDILRHGRGVLRQRRSRRWPAGAARQDGPQGDRAEQRRWIGVPVDRRCESRRHDSVRSDPAWVHIRNPLPAGRGVLTRPRIRLGWAKSLARTARSHWSMSISPDGAVPFVEGDASLRLRGSFCRADGRWRCGVFDRTRVVHLTYR